MKMSIEKMKVEQFQHDLIHWFKEEQRDLPWRKDSDPYKVWVSEIMLQQTRVDTVIPYYERFLEKFPTIQAFAAANEEEILKIWEGLGYYSRVRNLHSAVKEVVEQYGGMVPTTPDQIAKLKGVGPYTAGAILSIAYGLPEPAVDGNVMRVLSRILLIREDIAKASTRKIFEAAVRELIDHKQPSYFNQALMELGALICTPTSPSCLLCPVREHCSAFNEGIQEQLPIKTRKKNSKHVDLLVAVLKTADQRYLIRKRPSKGLLANLWEFPSVDINKFTHMRPELLGFLEKELNGDIVLETGTFTKVDHVFSHLTWALYVFSGELIEGEIPKNYRLVTVEELEEFAFPVSHQTIWKTYKEKYL